jgi:hypothetical protein
LIAIAARPLFLHLQLALFQFSQLDITPSAVLLHVAAEWLLAAQLVAVQPEVNQTPRLPKLHWDAA